VLLDDAQRLESLLARLFVDEELRARFKQDPDCVGKEFGLDGSALVALANADWVGLDLAARSYAHKRTRRPWWRSILPIR
jgi:hypothetical protein